MPKCKYNKKSGRHKWKEEMFGDGKRFYCSVCNSYKVMDGRRLVKYIDEKEIV